MMFRKVYQLVLPSVARGLALVLVNALSYSRLVLFTPSYVTSKNDNINKWYRDIMYTKSPTPTLDSKAVKMPLHPIADDAEPVQCPIWT
jgi:hypothetical protein